MAYNLNDINNHIKRLFTRKFYKGDKSAISLESDGVKLETKEGTAELRIFEPGERYIVWSVLDIEQQAKERWERHKDNYPGAKCMEDVYDTSKFQIVLDYMIDKHDACNGIVWETIDFWLDELALKEIE